MPETEENSREPDICLWGGGGGVGVRGGRERQEERVGGW